VPIIDLVSVTRFAMVPATIVGVLLALAADRRRAAAPPADRVLDRAGRRARAGAPKPLPVVAADPLPPFLTAGTWRRTCRPAAAWSGAAARGHHRRGRDALGRAVRPGVRRAARILHGTRGSARRPHRILACAARYTSDLLERVGRDGRVPVVTAADRRAFAEDLRFWRAGVVVLVPGARNEAQLQATLTTLFGQPPRVEGGVRLWIPPTG
jgi:hypothetical protein